MSRHFSRILVVCLFLALSAASAQADSINVYLDTFSNSGRANVRLGSTGESAYLGQMSVRAFEVDSLGHQTDSLALAGFAFCVDLPQPVNYGKNTGYQTAEASSVAGGLETVWLMENFSPGMGYDTSNPAAVMAGLQLAIWEVVYDTWTPTQDYSLSGPGSDANKFWVESANYSILSMANSFLTALGEAKQSGVFESQALTASYKYTAVVSPNKQDLIVGDPTATPGVPEPGSMLLLGSALFGLAASRRKKLAGLLRRTPKS